MTLMIVEDNLEFRVLLRKLLEEHFTGIYETDSGEEALRIYESKEPDWVFMDIEIRKLDGITAARQIVSKYPEAKIVMLSQYINPKVIRAAMKAGAVEYVTKDDISKLFNIINKS